MKSRFIITTIIIVVILIIIYIFFGLQSSPFPSYVAQGIISNFDKNSEGWQVSGDAQEGDIIPNYYQAGGVVGGYISATDNHDGGTFYFVAPETFLGNKQSFIGGTLEYSLRQSDASEQFIDDDIIIEGEDGKIVYRFNNSPGTEWTQFHVALDATDDWHLNSFEGDKATTEDIYTVLSNIVSLKIRGEYSNKKDTNGLDSVKFIPLLQKQQQQKNQQQNNKNKKTSGNYADMSITKKADKDSAEIGDTITYTIVATNNGPKVATDITITDALPFGAVVKSISVDKGDCDVIVGVPMCDVEKLGPNESATVQLTVLAADTSIDAYVNIANVAAVDNDKEPKANNKAISITSITKKKVAKNSPQPKNEEVSEMSYGGASCGFTEAKVIGGIDKNGNSVVVEFLPESNPMNGPVTFTGSYAAYEYDNLVLFPGSPPPQDTYYATVEFSNDDKTLTLRGVDPATGFQLCIGTFEKGAKPGPSNFVPAKAPAGMDTDVPDLPPGL